MLSCNPHSAQTLQMVIVNGEATKPRRNKNNNILTTNKQEVKIMYPTRTNSWLPEIFNDFINTVKCNFFFDFCSVFGLACNVFFINLGVTR